MIFGYKICHKLTSSDERRCGYVDHNATTYNVTELNPYTHYDIEISVGTVAGYGPPVLLKDRTNQWGRLLSMTKPSPLLDWEIAD